MLTDKVLRTIEKHGMFSPGDTVVVAVSGGMDSVVLLHVLYTLKDQLQISLHVAHLNHGIRGKDADEDAEFVSDMAEALNLPCSIERVDVPMLKQQWGMGTEEAARKTRYEFLNRVADQTGALRIATAHTASDQVETLLMNMLRGTGIEGLSGIPAVRERIVRPMIDVFRRDVEEYTHSNNLSYRQDATNLELTYTRNRIRHQLLPALRDFNPRVDDALARLAETSREDNELLEELTDSVYRSIHVRDDDTVSFPMSDFKDQPVSIQRRLIRRAASEVLGSLVDIGFIHVENLLMRLDDPGVYEVELPQGTARVRKTPEYVSIYLVKPEADIPEVHPRTLDIPGETEVPELNIKTSAEPLKAPVDWRRPRESMDVVIDADKISGTLTVRSWLPGDRLTPLGMSQSKKLQNLFVDRKVPKDRRGLIPVITDEERILWVAGVSLAQEAAVTSETERFISLKVEPL